MTTETTNTDAGSSPVQRGVMRQVPTGATCEYCKKPDKEWSDEDLKRGKRFKPNLLEYHCVLAFYGAQ